MRKLCRKDETFLASGTDGGLSLLRDRIVSGGPLHYAAELEQCFVCGLVIQDADGYTRRNAPAPSGWRRFKLRVPACSPYLLDLIVCPLCYRGDFETERGLTWRLG